MGRHFRKIHFIYDTLFDENYVITLISFARSFRKPNVLFQWESSLIYPRLIITNKSSEEIIILFHQIIINQVSSPPSLPPESILAVRSSFLSSNVAGKGFQVVQF